MSDTITPSFSGPALPAQYTDIGNEGFGEPSSTSLFEESSFANFSDPDAYGDLMNANVWHDYMLQRMAQAIDRQSLNTNNRKGILHYYDTTLMNFQMRMKNDGLYRENPKLAKWVEMLMSCFKQPKGKEHHYNSPEIARLRKSMLRSPEHMLDVFWRVIADRQLDLLQSRNLTDVLVGSQEFSDGHLSQVANKLMEQSKDFMRLNATRPMEGVHWATSQGFFNSLAGLPKTLPEMMPEIFKGGNHNTNVEDLRNMLQTGVQWNAFQHEQTIRSALETFTSGTSAFFSQNNVGRMFGPRRSAMDSPDRMTEYCKVFHGLRDVLFDTNTPPCSVREEYRKVQKPKKRPIHDPNSDDVAIAYGSRSAEAAYTPDVPQSGLTEPQINCLWGFYAPLMMGLMYPFFSLPQPNCKHALMNNMHSSFVLAAHGISNTGACLIQNVIPFLATVYNSRKGDSPMMARIRAKRDKVNICAIGFGNISFSDEERSLDVASSLQNFAGLSNNPVNKTDMSSQWNMHAEVAANGFVPSAALVQGAAASAVTADNAFEKMFELGCSNTEEQCFQIANGMEFSSTNIPPLFIVKATDGDSMYNVYIDPKKKNGIPCHTKKLVDFYLKHFHHKNTLCKNLHTHNYLLERLDHDRLRENLPNNTDGYKSSRNPSSVLYNDPPFLPN